MVGILDYGLAKVADRMIKFVISPAIKCGLPISFIQDLKKVPEELTESLLKIVPSIDSKVNIV